MASLNEFDGEYVFILVCDDRGEEVGEVMFLVVVLLYGSDGCVYVCSVLFIVYLSVSRVKVEVGVVGLRIKFVLKNVVWGVGLLNIVVWIGLLVEVIGMGVRNDGEEGIIVMKVTVRVILASSAIIVVVRSVRGLLYVEGEFICCIFMYGL